MTYLEMVLEALSDLKERNGSSQQAIKKHIITNNEDMENTFLPHALRTALKKGIQQGLIEHPEDKKTRFKLTPEGRKEEVEKLGHGHHPATPRKRSVTVEELEEAPTPKLARAAPKKKATAATTRKHAVPEKTEAKGSTGSKKSGRPTTVAGRKAASEAAAKKREAGGASKGKKAKKME